MHEPISEKSFKFRALAEKRVSKALLVIQQIGNLSSKAYEHTPDEVAQIFDTLREELSAAEGRFNPASNGKQRPIFRLD
jgi:hypothetical protein